MERGILFDGHCDTLLRCWHKSSDDFNGGKLLENTGHVDLCRAGKRLSRYAQFFAIFGSSIREEPGERVRIFYEQAELFKREIEENADLVMHCRTAREAEDALKQGKIAAFLAVEGAELLNCDLNLLERAYALGVRAINLTWNYENLISGSNMQNADRGLSELGKKFVRRMQELGILVDVSHLSDPGFWDVAELAAEKRIPFIAGHSNSRSVYSHSRNLTDEQFTAIIKSQGVAGVNLVSELLGEDATLDTVIAHIEHWMSLGGRDSVAIGTDFDGGTPCRGIKDITDIGKIREKLLQMNYSENTVNAIFFDNMMRVVQKVCTM